MNAEALLTDLEARGATLAINGDQLRLEAPEESVTPELIDELRARKAELLQLLEKRRKKQDSSGPDIADVEAMTLSEFAQAGLIVRLGTAEEWGSDVLVVSDDVPEAEARKLGLAVYRASELRKIHILRPKPHEMRLLNEVKTIFNQTIVSVEPKAGQPSNGSVRLAYERRGQRNA